MPARVMSYAEVKARRQADRAARVDDAARDFDEGVEDYARGFGLCLREVDINHYHLEPLPKGSGWLINLYPSNRRIYHEKSRGRAPYIELHEGPWTLKNIVDAAVESLRERQRSAGSAT